MTEVIQLSTGMNRVVIKQTGKSMSKDTITDSTRVVTTFNRYIHPGDGAWFEKSCVAVHEIHASDQRIFTADRRDIVRHDFLALVNDNMSADMTTIHMVYNGKNCNMKWLW